MSPSLTPALVAHVRLYLDSYERLLGQPLVPSGSDEERARALFEAPFFAVSHGTESDPVFDFGNHKALELWELSFDDFVRLPSRLSAEAAHREERRRLLDHVSTHGYSTGYSGVRISKSGRRFRIEDATVWNLVDEGGVHRGQGAVCWRWTFL